MGNDIVDRTWHVRLRGYVRIDGNGKARVGSRFEGATEYVWLYNRGKRREEPNK